MVEFNSVTIPWHNGGKSSGKYKDYHATAWKPVAAGEGFSWMPYEFAFAPDHAGVSNAGKIDLDDAKYKDFLDEFLAALRSARLEQLIGLSVLPSKDYMDGLEFTEGKANIVLRADQVSISLSYDTTND